MILTLPVTLYGIRCFIPAFVSYMIRAMQRYIKNFVIQKTFRKKIRYADRLHRGNKAYSFENKGIAQRAQAYRTGTRIPLRHRTIEPQPPRNRTLESNNQDPMHHL